MKAFVLVPILLAACAHDSGSVSGPAVPAGKYALQLKLNPGEVRKYTVQVKVHTKALVNDATMFDSPMTMKYTAVLETGARGADGTTELKEHFENFDFSAEGPMGEMIKQMAQGLNKAVVISSVRPDGTTASSKTEGVEPDGARLGQADGPGRALHVLAQIASRSRRHLEYRGKNAAQRHGG
jgi:hypothetical protein